jgi:hypothetical protein
LGAVWYFPCGCDTIYNTASVKPIRLNRSDYGKVLQRGDCLRIHFNPRRFLTVHDYSFAASAASTISSENIKHGKKGVILHEDFQLGFTIINKPPYVPGMSFIAKNHSLYKEFFLTNTNESFLPFPCVTILSFLI